MYAELQQYLIHYKKLPVPGIGTFLLVRTPAFADITNRVVEAPVYNIIHKAETEPFPRHFFSWLGYLMGVTDREAQRKLEEFSSEIRKNVLSGQVIHWKGVGQLRKKEGDAIGFIAGQPLAEMAVPAVKVIRENAQHRIRVGEDIRTKDEMTQILTEKPAARKFTLLIPWILLLLAMGFITWYVLINGVSGALQHK